MKKDKDAAVVAQIVHDYIGVHETPYIEFTARDTSEYREPVLVEIARGPRKSPAQGWTGSRCRCTTPTEAPAPLQYMRSISVPESASIPGVGSHKVGILLKRTKISPHPHNASVREDLLKDYIDTRVSSNHEPRAPLPPAAPFMPWHAVTKNMRKSTGTKTAT